MFVHALEIANWYTFPYVGLRHRVDGAVTTNLAAFVILNDDGWVLTAGHVALELLDVRKKVAATQGQAHGRTADTVLHHAEIWAVPGFERTRPSAIEVRVDAARDLAVVRLDGIEELPVGSAPRFRSLEAPVQPGMSVVRLGFPFYDVGSGYDAPADEFRLAPGAFPVPRFALDAIVSRFRNQVGEDGRTATFIETSTPGLRGQSGGPLLDTDGRICGIQSHTAHLDLGFDARYEREGRAVVERQFLNVGAATHVKEVLAFLDEQDIAYETA